ncbi:MAG: putative HAD superfamily sugar phosphatase [Candidatus Nanosalina sp. J07AB43]|nr:MAG: putative HAD superfamily sugar phosphatase [Candidatus Nanosalina sp. J07AB43]
MDLSENRTFFFDLDDTLWNWDEFKSGALDLLESLESAGRNVYFHTDNTLHDREGYARKLSKMGFETDEDQIITSGFIASKILNENNITKAYVVGESGLVSEVQDSGIEISADAAYAVVGLDRSFSYDKLEKLRKITGNGGQVLVCSNEKYFSRKDRKQVHQKALNSAINEFADSRLVGKPSQDFIDCFKDYFSYFPGKSVFIGDRPSDIEAGNKLGMSTAAVMQGSINEETLRNLEGKQVPDYALTRLDKLRRRVI